MRGDAKDRFGHLDTPLPVIIHTVILLNQEIIKQFTKYVKFKVDNVVAEPGISLFLLWAPRSFI